VKVRRRVLDAARSLGVESHVRRVQRAVASSERRRDWQDNRHIELLLAYTLREDANCIDVGASEGDILQHMVRLAPCGRHIAFEPLPDLAARLRTSFPSVDVRQCALYDEAGTRAFHRVRASHWHSSLDPMERPAREIETFDVAVRRLDDVLPRDYEPAVIKVDVEGAEAQMLTGALQTLRRHRPLVIFEHGSHAAYFPGRDVFELLTEGAGLRIFDIDGGGPYDAAAFAARVRRGDLWTFVARL
jgi:FkbM family methyltransferase